MRSTIGTDVRRAAALALLATLLVSVCLPVPVKADQADVDLMLANSAVSMLNLTDAEGNSIQPRKTPEVLGRGNPDVAGVEPDYRIAKPASFYDREALNDYINGLF